jgi:3-carboxy-cis,cis-muconate cycloisomerase
MLDAMLHDGERATGPWHAEWLALPEACLLAHGIVVRARELLAGLVVRPAAMRRNLALTRGLLNAEAVMMALAPALGRQAAHDAVYAAAMRAIAADRPLREEVLADPAIAAHLSPAELDRLLAPEHYLGLATAFVDRVLAGGDAGEQG